MHLSHPLERVEPLSQRRRVPRLDIQCRARIRIGDRQYAGYIHNISRGGARLRTVSPIRRLGAVVLGLPDLPPLRCQLRWTDSYHAGVMFEMPLAATKLRSWAKARLELRGNELGQAEFAEIVEFLGVPKSSELPLSSLRA